MAIKTYKVTFDDGSSFEVVAKDHSQARSKAYWHLRHFIGYTKHDGPTPRMSIKLVRDVIGSRSTFTA